MAQASSESQATSNPSFSWLPIAASSLAKRVGPQPDQRLHLHHQLYRPPEPDPDPSLGRFRSERTPSVVASGDAMDIKASVRPLLKQKKFPQRERPAPDKQYARLPRSG
jgi:hypothetical protein